MVLLITSVLCKFSEVESVLSQKFELYNMLCIIFCSWTKIISHVSCSFLFFASRMFDISFLFIGINSILTLLGCFINLFLCYLAIFQSPKAIRTYSLVLINITLTNVGACVTGFLLDQRIIQSGKSMLYVSYGYCSLLGEGFCFNM